MLSKETDVEDIKRCIEDPIYYSRFQKIIIKKYYPG